jgi:hypothetical protein
VMTDILVQSNTAPTISGAITNTETGAPQPLAGCTVYFQMRRTIDRRWRINAEATITDAAAGVVEYELQPGDLDFSGDSVARFLVIYPDGRRQSTTPLSEVTVEAP